MSVDGAPVLELRKVSTHYGLIAVLRDVNVEIRPGEIVCLLGGNASGKSTTLKTILGMVTPSEGEVLFDGQLIGKLRDERGFTIVVIEHDMRLVKGVSDRVVALDYGRKIADGTYDEVANDERVVEAYLGKRAAEEAAG